MFDSSIIDNQNKNIFLGIWCEEYNGKNRFETLKYHWYDRQKAFRDHNYLYNLKKVLLVLLAEKLNIIHSTNYCTKSWDIMIGYWLQSFISVSFDRWEQLNYSKYFNSCYSSSI